MYGGKWMYGNDVTGDRNAVWGNIKKCRDRNI